MENPNERTEIVEGKATGYARAIRATASAIEKLESSISRLTSSTKDQNVNIPEINSIKVEFIGNALLDNELDQAKNVLEAAFPNIPLVYSSEPPRLTMKASIGGEFKTRLEALVTKKDS